MVEKRDNRGEKTINYRQLNSLTSVYCSNEYLIFKSKMISDIINFYITITYYYKIIDNYLFDTYLYDRSNYLSNNFFCIKFYEKSCANRNEFFFIND